MGLSKSIFDWARWKVGEMGVRMFHYGQNARLTTNVGASISPIFKRAVSIASDIWIDGLMNYSYKLIKQASDLRGQGVVFQQGVCFIRRRTH